MDNMLYDILIVDDDPGNLKLLEGILEDNNYNIRSATDTKMALRSIKAKLPFIILLDVQLPGINGFEFCRSLKEDESTKGIPVIFITAHTSPEYIIKGFEAGGIDYIMKPFIVEEVLARVNTHVTNRKTLLEINRQNNKLQNEIEKLRLAEEELAQNNKLINSLLEQEKKNKNALLSILNDQKETVETLRKSEDELKKANIVLKQLYTRQEEIKENERKTISREIHDELGQLLVALKIDMGWVNDNIENAAEAKTRITGMNNIVNETIEIIHRIAFDLRPGFLDELGLVPSIECYCQNMEKRTGIAFNLKSDDILSANEKINLTLYHILQEALTNVVRHAKAKKVNIYLYKAEGASIMEIIDDGIGMNHEKINALDSLGLIGIRERLEQYNGSLEITSNRNKGTKLQIKIPVNPTLTD
jgi:signal transduction histidine kinase